jgi:hypothetical protein
MRIDYLDYSHCYPGRPQSRSVSSDRSIQVAKSSARVPVGVCDSGTADFILTARCRFFPFNSVAQGHHHRWYGLDGHDLRTRPPGLITRGPTFQVNILQVCGSRPSDFTSGCWTFRLRRRWQNPPALLLRRTCPPCTPPGPGSAAQECKRGRFLAAGRFVVDLSGRQPYQFHDAP